MTTTFTLPNQMLTMEDDANGKVSTTGIPVFDDNVVRLIDIGSFISAPYFVSTITEATGEGILAGNLMYLHADGWKKASNDGEAAQAVAFSLGPPILAVMLGVLNILTDNPGHSQGDIVYLDTDGKANSVWPGVDRITQNLGFVIQQFSSSLVQVYFSPKIITMGV